MRASKAVAYELTKIVPLEVLETYRGHEGHANDLRKVGGVLIETHLPGWLYYAINESDDHEVTNLDRKLIDYIDDETIVSVAEEYAEKPDSVVLNLNRPGERDWMQEDPMAPYRNQFQEEYDSAVTAISSVLDDVFSAEFEAYDDADYRKEIATHMVDAIDMFSWELYRQETPDDCDADRQVAEWLVSNISILDFADSYMDTSERDIPEESERQAEISHHLRERFRQALNSADLAEYDGVFPTRGVLPRDEERHQEQIENARENLNQPLE